MTKSSPCVSPRLAAKKRSRQRAELEVLAALFQADWRPGDKVGRWLSRHEGKTGELSRLVDEGWSWADIGLAMQIAGICYSSGQPIAGDILRFKAYHARRSRAVRTAREASKALNVEHETGDVASVPFQPGSTVFAPVAGRPVTIPTTEVPKFRPVRLRSDLPACKPQSSPQRPLYPQAETPEISDEEIVRRVLGKG